MVEVYSRFRMNRKSVTKRSKKIERRKNDYELKELEVTTEPVAMSCMPFDWNKLTGWGEFIVMQPRTLSEWRDL